MALAGLRGSLLRGRSTKSVCLDDQLLRSGVAVSEEYCSEKMPTVRHRYALADMQAERASVRTKLSPWPSPESLLARLRGENMLLFTRVP